MIPEITLSSGSKMPVLGLGTWQLRGDICRSVIKMAYQLGYRHFDTAWFYNNQEEIGQAFKEIRVSRSDIFVTSKIWRDSLRAPEVYKQFQDCLDQLQMDYIDLLLIHWPNPEVHLEETLGAFTELYQKGKIKSLGVSNFDIELIEKAKSIAPISVNQIRCHIGYRPAGLIKYCQQNKIAITAYSPLAKRELFNYSMVQEIANELSRTSAQVALRWLVQQEVLVIPKASSKQHLQANLGIFDWDLTPTQVAQLNQIE